MVLLINYLLKNNHVFSLYFSVIPALYEMMLFVVVFGFKRKPLWGFLLSWFRRILSFHDWRTRISWNQNNIHWHNKLVFSMRLLRRVLRLLNYVWRLFDGFMWLQITALNLFLENNHILYTLWWIKACCILIQLTNKLGLFILHIFQ